MLLTQWNCWQGNYWDTCTDTLVMILEFQSIWSLMVIQCKLVGTCYLWKKLENMTHSIIYQVLVDPTKTCWRIHKRTKEKMLSHHAQEQNPRNILGLCTSMDYRIWEFIHFEFTLWQWKDSFRIYHRGHTRHQWVFGPYILWLSHLKRKFRFRRTLYRLMFMCVTQGRTGYVLLDLTSFRNHDIVYHSAEADALREGNRQMES